MTIGSQTSRIAYTGDGSTTAFSVPFYFSANADLVVSVEDLSGNITTKLLGTDYDVTGATLSAGGTCTFVTAPTSGFLIAITRVPALTQTTSYNNNDPFPAKSHELALDKLTTVDQYLKTLIDRAIIVASTDTPPLTTLPPASVRALKSLTFDSLGNPTVSTPVSGSSVSSAMIPVIAASTLAIARSLLGIVNAQGIFGTRTLAAAATIDSAVESVSVAGYASAGDGGAASYKRVVSLTSGAAGFQSADGAWWQLSDPIVNLKMFGGVGDGSTANDTAFTAAWTHVVATTSNGGDIIIPAGKYKFTSQVAKTLPNSKTAMSLRGAGDGATILYWPNAAGGMKFTWANPLNTMHFRDLSFTTGVTNGGYAVDLQSTFYISGSSIWNSFERVSCHGDDGGGVSFYWTGGIRAHAVSEINFTACNFYGTAAGLGDGIHLEGDTGTSTYGVLYNIDKCFFNYTGTGINYGSYVQGVTVNACNFNGQASTAGIQAPAGMTGVLAQLAVSNCQFDTGAIAIYAGTAINNCLIVNNALTVSKNNGVGIYLQASFGFQITGNYISTYGSPTAVTGVIIGPPGFGTITGNAFANMSVGYNLNASTANVSGIGNAFNTVTTKFVNSGSSQAPGSTATVMP